MVILNEWIFESYLLINASIFCPVICFNQFFDDSYQLICVILELIIKYPDHAKLFNHG